MLRDSLASASSSLAFARFVRFAVAAAVLLSSAFDKRRALVRFVAVALAAAAVVVAVVVAAVVVVRRRVAVVFFGAAVEAVEVGVGVAVVDADDESAGATVRSGLPRVLAADVVVAEATLLLLSTAVVAVVVVVETARLLFRNVGILSFAVSRVHKEDDPIFFFVYKKVSLL